MMRSQTTACTKKIDGSLHCSYANVGDVTIPGIVIGEGRERAGVSSPVSEWNCFLRQDRSVACWLSNNGSSITFTDFDVAGGDVIDLALGDSLEGLGFDGCAIKSDRSLWCWGLGILGDGSDWNDVDNRPPTEIPTLRGRVAKVVLGQTRKCALTTDNALYCWGDTFYDAFAQQGPLELEPVEVTALGHQVADVDMGLFHTCALMLDGRLFCFGDNTYGQVTGDDYGVGKTVDYRTPREITALGSDVADVAAGYFHTCARKSDDSVWCWGNNGTGQLGHRPVNAATTTVDPVPRQVVGCPAR